MSEEAASQHPHPSPRGPVRLWWRARTAPHTPLPSGWDTQEASIYVSGTVRLLAGGGGQFAEKSKATSCPIRGPGSHGPPCPAPARAPRAPSPSVGGRRLSLPRPLSCMLAQTVPSPITGKEPLDQTPHHDHPFLDPDSSPPDHRGPGARTQLTWGTRSSSSFLCQEPRRWKPFLSVVRPDRSL